MRQSEPDYFACPGCGGALQWQSQGCHCVECAAAFGSTDGIAQLYWANEPGALGSDVTDRVKDFYEDSPFPDYDEFETIDGLADKARQGLFARLLDEQIPAGARVLECGCGTGQLSNFLSQGNREVVGADLCLNSLRLGSRFARSQRLDNVRFVQMNLFRPPFKQERFHLVICNGVLHHTSDPRGGFETIAGLVKPGGYLIVGLYHYWGRLITDTRRVIFRVTGDRFKSLDPNLVRPHSSPAKKRAWFKDQYQHPHESKHRIAEVLGWLDGAGLSFVSSIPSTHLFRDFSPSTSLFTAQRPAARGEMAVRELLEVFKGSREGGFFTIIGQKRK